MKMVEYDHQPNTRFFLNLLNGSQKSTGTKVKSSATREDVIYKNTTIHKMIHLLSLFKIVLSFNKYELIC